MFKVKKPFLLLEIPYCEQKKIASKQFINKFYQFTGDKYVMIVKWLTKKVKSLSPLKRRNLHHSCRSCKGICRCGGTCIGETICNVEKRWSEYNSAGNKSEPAKQSIFLMAYLSKQKYKSDNGVLKLKMEEKRSC